MTNLVVSTLEERALADSDDSDRFLTSERGHEHGDAIDSFVAQTRALVAVTAERDAARIKATDCLALGSAVIERLTAERDAALTALNRIEALAKTWTDDFMMRDATGDDRDDRADARDDCAMAIRAALEPTP